MPDRFIPLMSPDIRESDIKEVVKVLESGMLVQGTYVEKLENNVASFLNAKYAVAVSNGTASLHLALIALGVNQDDEVIVPALSYIATANVVELVGAKPVFVDVSLATFNIDVNQIEEKITSKTKVIIAVHEFGLACDIAKLMDIARRYGLKVIEDAACALGATENGQFAGTFGDIGSFSFHPRKAITGGEGGMLITNNSWLAEKFKILRNHGISMENGKIKFVAAGFNYRLTDFQAALINSQFKRLEGILLYRDQLASFYLQNLKAEKCVILPAKPEGKRHTWQSFHIILGDAINRDQFINKLKDRGVGTNYGAQCIPYQQYYQEKYKVDSEELFPNALKAYKHGLVLPLYEKLSVEDIRRVVMEIRNILADV